MFEVGAARRGQWAPGAQVDDGVDRRRRGFGIGIGIGMEYTVALTAWRCRSVSSLKEPAALG